MVSGSFLSGLNFLTKAAESVVGSDVNLEAFMVK